MKVLDNLIAPIGVFDDTNNTFYLQTVEEVEGSCIGCAFLEREHMCKPDRYDRCAGRIFKHSYETSGSV